MSKKKADRFRYLLLKARVMGRYGGRCEACHIDEIAVLCLDHRDDDGAFRRRSGLDHTGKTFYQALLDAPLRSDLCVLCANCNQRKRNYGPNYSEWPIDNRNPRDIV